VPRFAKWAIAIVVGVGVFALTWWVCAGPFAMGTGEAVAVATVLGGSLSTPIAWWAGRETTAPVREVPDHRPREQVVPGAPIVEPAPERFVVGPVPREPQHFQPRPAEVDQLRQLAGSGEVAVVPTVTGQRGVGKTQLAGMYARDRIAEGWSVAWIRAENADLVLAGLVELAVKLGLVGEEDVAAVEAERVRTHLHEASRVVYDKVTAAVEAERVRTHLQTRQEPLLVVLDNVTDPTHVTPHLPATGNAQIVLTSTSRAVERIGTVVVPVGLFTTEVAVQFLVEATGVPDTEGAEALADELGCLPLALAQAAARIATVERDYRTYLDRLRAVSIDQYLKAKPEDPYPHGVAEAILLALEPYSTPGTRERDFLELFSVLSPDGVSRAVLATAHRTDAEHDNVLERLLEASLVEFAGDTDYRAVVMHRLTQRVLRERADANLPVVIDNAVGLIGDATILGLEGWPTELCAELVRHIDALWQHALSQACFPTTVTRLLALRNWEVRYLVETDPDRAVDLAVAVHADHSDILGADHPNTLHAANNFAAAFLAAHPYSMVTTVHEQALAARHRVLGDKHPDTIASADALASALELMVAHVYYDYQENVETPELDDAIQTAERALTGCRKALGDTDPTTLSLAINLATAYQGSWPNRGSYPAAGSNSRRLSEGARRLAPHHGQTSPRTASRWTCPWRHPTNASSMWGVSDSEPAGPVAT
jgi:hypothetical protein